MSGGGQHQPRGGGGHGQLDKRKAIDNPYVDDHTVPKKIAGIQFGMLPGVDMRTLSEVEIVNRSMYKMNTRIPESYGPLDPKLGVSVKKLDCSTCGQKVDDCPGHFGFVSLQLPVFHIGYIKQIHLVLKLVCKSCCRVALPDSAREKFLKDAKRARKDPQKIKHFVKEISKAVAQNLNCPHCGELNGDIRRIPPMKFVHNKWKKRAAEGSRAEFEQLFTEAAKSSPDLKQYISKAQDDLNPLRVRDMFCMIPDADLPLIMMHKSLSRPEWMVLTHVPVPPASIRPSVVMDASGSNEDDLTVQIGQIISLNRVLRGEMQKGGLVLGIIERWDVLQDVVAELYNAEAPGLQSKLSAAGSKKAIRGICQRLKGKQGRFRGNLSGKRVDFSSRTVISPDPNLRIDEVGVPEDVAKVLTFTEKVFEGNIEHMRQLVRNGWDIHPGAKYLITRDGNKTMLRIKADAREKHAMSLRPGDEIERHLIDGDVVLFNRQPSLHRVSIMAHRARVMQYRTFRFNECVCTPYNADFDGDEMNLHLPQTQEARAEALTLMSVTQNLAVPKSGELLISATQDFLTASWVITSKDRFFTKEEFNQVIAGFLTDHTSWLDIELPPPTIWKPLQLWTGKQIFSILISPNKKDPVKLTMDCKLKNYNQKTHPGLPPFMSWDDQWMVVADGELLAGQLDKGVLGGGKTTLFAHMLKHYSPEVAADRMSKLARMCARYLMNHGFSIGISDVTPSPALIKSKNELITKGYNEATELIQKAKSGQMQADPGSSLEATLEGKLSGVLSELRDKAGNQCTDDLSANFPLNSPLIMTLCGSKGSKINIAQMISCVGQQTVSGSRIPEGFVDRTLPHFDIKAREPAAKGFVSNSFFSGLTPTEFFFHTMGGREGLIDTAVKTAETGYMQRRLMKALEDLAVQYDNTVRVSTGTVVQFTYGDDGVEPTVTEAKDTPVDLLTLWNGIQKKYPFNLQPGDSYPLQPRQLIALVEQELLKDELFYNRPLGKPMKIREVAFKFFDDMRKELIMLRGTMGVSEDSDVLGELPPLAGPDGEVRRNWTLLQRENAVATITHATKIQIAEFFKKFTFKLRIAHAEPGTAVGALAGQSIGEPCTQMTLKTFHFAGVASMNITQGVPRIREIINASKKISTPIVEVELANTRDPILAQRVRSQLERTSLADVAAYVREEYHKDSGYILVKLDDDRIQRLMLDLDANAVKVRLLAARKLKLLESDVQVCGKRGNKLMIFAPKKFFSTARTKDRVQNTYITLQALKLALVNVTVAGFDTVKRCVIREKDAEYTVFVEGHELAGAMSVQGVVSKNIKANHILDVCGTLGIEAARRSIIDEIQDTMEHHGVGVDPRHLYLLADCMTYTGSVLGITRFGISKMRDSVLNLASFERTTDYLFDAGVYAKSDTISGVSECIIMGRPVPLGTSLCQVLHKPEYSHRGASYLPKVTLFEKHAGSQ